MVRGVLDALGTVFLLFGMVGVVVPGLPTTPFVLLAAFCYIRSSRRHYHRLLEHRLFGKIIRDFQAHRSIPREAKIVSVAAMAIMVTVSVVFFVQALWLKVLLCALGAAGIALVLHLKNSNENPPACFWP